MVTPTWAISPAACTALCSTSPPVGGSTGRDRSSRVGAGTASGRGFDVVRGGVGLVAFGFAAARGFAAVLFLAVAAGLPFAAGLAARFAAGLDALAFAVGLAAAPPAPGSCAAVRAAFAACGSVAPSPLPRRALRRCGRLRGRL